MKHLRVVSIVLIITLLLSLMTLTSFAVEQGVINGSDGELNVRDLPGGENSKVIDTLKNGTVVDILSTQGNWYYIGYTNAEGKTVNGYVYCSYVKFVSADDEPEITDTVPAIYSSYVSKLKAQHPNWQFKFYNTGIEWDSVVANEIKAGVNAIAGAPLSYRSTSVNFKSEGAVYYDGYVSSEYVIRDKGSYIVKTSGSNLTLRSAPSTDSQAVASIPNSTVIFVNGVATDENNTVWYNTRYYESYGTYTYKNVEGISWFQPHGQVVRYYLDPRNFFDEKTVFQFESLTFDSSVHTLEGVQTIIKGSFMDGVSITTTDNRTVTYAQAIMEAAKKYNISPYHIASRIIQEVGKNGSIASSGTSVLYPGIYNLYNIGANTGVLDGLNWASKGTTYQRPWNTPYKSLMGGAEFIAAGYISVGQSTLYFQKFDVVNNGTRYYDHQYMSNIVAPSAEGTNVFKAYKEMGISDSKLVFLIPVYKNMPTFAYPLPASYNHPNMLADSQEGYFEQFLDVRSGTWYYDAVMFVLENGYMFGYGNGYFGIGDIIKREDFAVVLARVAAANLPKYNDTELDMPDVPSDSSFKNAVAWAVDKKIISGYDDGNFGVGDDITREQLCTVIYRYAESIYADLELSDSVENILSVFDDSDTVSGFARTAVAWCVDNGIIKGNDNGSFLPRSSTSRAEFAVIIKRMVDNGLYYKGYPDVAMGTWYYDAVQTNTHKRFMSGYSNGKFGPADSVQRQDFVLIMSRVDGGDISSIDTAVRFPDAVSGSYYYDAVKWSVQNGIIKGYNNGKFGVGDKLTRQDACTIIYRFAEYRSLDTEVDADKVDGLLSGYSDYGLVSGYAKTALAWCVENGVISGKNATTLAPRDYISRAEIAQILMNMINHGLL